MPFTRIITISLLLATSLSTLAVQDDPSEGNIKIPRVKFPLLPKEGHSITDFIPLGWTLETCIEGDLNKDGKNDVVFVLRQNSKKNIVRNKFLGVPELNTNPRILAAVFAKQSAEGYFLMLQEQRLIPRHEDPILDDPFQELSMGKGTFNVTLHHWASAGSWGTATISFVFRYENDCFRLIGYDNLRLMRNTLEETSTSINLLTRQVKEIHTTYDESGEPVEKTRRMSLSRTTPICIDQIGNGIDFEPKSRK